EMRFPTAGTFTTDWQMVQDGVGWFGDTLAKDVTVNPIVERGAAMISNTIPDSVNAGETRSVSITVKNTGTLTWTAANGFALGIVDESDPFYTASNRVPLTRAVAPGETHTFTFDMSFPTAGTFTTDWRMVQDGVTWFGDTLAKNVTVNTVAQPLDAQIVSNTIPDVVNVGESRTVNVVVKNTGTLTWTPGGANYFALAAGDDNDPFAVSIRCGVESNVAPGGTYTFSFTMNFPTAGTFNTDWQMGQEGVGRFGGVLSKNVTVTAPERGAQMVSNTIPDSATVGETRTVTVTVKNTGSATWTPGGSNYYALAAGDDNDPFAASIRCGLDRNVAPGETYTFSFSMTFPSAGTFTTDWQMGQEGVTRFGEVLSKNVTVTGDVFNAKVISENIPTSMNTGETRSVSITMKNTGTESWHLSKEDYLGSPGNSDPFAPARHGVVTEVAPGGTYTVNFNMTAPSTPGTYTTDWQMIREYVAWYGEIISKNITVSSAELNAQMVSNTIPSAAIVGETRSVSITVKNTGTSTWSEATFVRLGIVDESDPFYQTSNRVILTKAVAPGETYTFTFDMSFPTAGTFTTDWQMIKDGVAWFGDILAKDVTVSAPVRAAQMISNTIPDTAALGETRSVSVTVKNTGNVTWTPGGNNYFALSAGDDNDPFAASIRCGVANNVNPGDTYTFTFDMTFSAAGTFTTDWQMGQEGVGRFGDILSKNVTVSAPVFDARITANTIPDTMYAGETRTVSVTVKNVGTESWNLSKDDYLGSPGNSDPFAPARHGVVNEVRSGQTYVFNFRMTAPTTPGTYTTDWQMIREYVAWYGDVLTKQVKVNAAPNATTYYVSPNGNDDNNGTSRTTPWKTITNGDVKGILNPGDTVIIMAGTYNVSGAMNDRAIRLIDCAGTSVAPITYRGESGAKVVGGGSGLTTCLQVSANYIVIDGLELTGAAFPLCSNHNAAGLVIKNCKIHDTSYVTSIEPRSAGIYLEADNCNATVSNCEIYNIGIDAGRRCAGIYNMSGYWLTNGVRSTYHHNYIHDIGGDGLGFYIRGGATDDHVYNNTVTNVNCGTYSENGSANHGSLTATNNIFVNCSTAVFGCDASGGFSTINNYNLVWNSGENIGYGQGTIFADPQFTTVPVISGASDAVNRGVDVGLPYNGAAPDMGCYETDYTQCVWDIYKDYSVVNNPNGVWNFGWELPRTGSNGTTFTKYTLLDEAGQGDRAWRAADDFDDHGYVGYRPVAGVHNEWQQWRKPYTVFLGSTFGAGWTTVRFTAPYANTYTFEIKFQACGQTDNYTTVYIDKNGTNLYTDLLTGTMYGDAAETEKNTLYRTFTLNLNAGDRIDLVKTNPTPVGSCSLLPIFRVTAGNQQCIVSGTVTSSYGGGAVSGA
ncbi:MAG: hypothetical protein J6X38_02280, partial [Abditibacteriota bacterium]|nr:hypothetical protein [Abditibacteriota bacterium]